MTPQTTPREALYMETGLLDIETINKKNRISMQKRVNTTPASMTAKVLNEGIKGGWKEETERLIKEEEITHTEMGGPKHAGKKARKDKIYKRFFFK